MSKKWKFSLTAIYGGTFILFTLNKITAEYEVAEVRGKCKYHFTFTLFINNLVALLGMHDVAGMILCLLHSSAYRFDALLPKPSASEENCEVCLRSIIDHYHSGADTLGIKCVEVFL